MLFTLQLVFFFSKLKIQPIKSLRLLQRIQFMNIDSRINKYIENKQNKTMIMILRVAMQIRMNFGRNEDEKKKQK
jgi:hypothetical protein